MGGHPSLSVLPPCRPIWLVGALRLLARGDPEGALPPQRRPVRVRIRPQHSLAPRGSHRKPDGAGGRQGLSGLHWRRWRLPTGGLRRSGKPILLAWATRCRWPRSRIWIPWPRSSARSSWSAGRSCWTMRKPGGGWRMPSSAARRASAPKAARSPAGWSAARRECPAPAHSIQRSPVRSASLSRPMCARSDRMSFAVQSRASAATVSASINLRAE